MAKSGSIRAGKAYVELFADSSRLIKGLRLAERKLRAFGNNIRNLGLKMTALGAAVTLPVLKAARSFSKMGDQVAKMAKRTGLSVETLSELRYVASQTGTEFESLEMAFRRMQRSIYDAGRGLSTAVDALADLGLTFEDLKDLSPEEQFKLLAERLSLIEDPTRRAGIAMSLFGRSGTNLLPMFAAGAAGIEKLQKEARELGLTISSVDAAAAEEFTDALDRLWKSVKMGVFYVGASLAPALQKVSEMVTKIIAHINKWINANRGLIVMVAAVGAALVTAGLLLITFGASVSLVAAMVGKLAAVFKLTGSAVSLLLSPVGLVVTALSALAAAIVYYSGTGGKAIEWLKGKLNSLASDAKLSISAISNALAAGDIALAAQILWLTLKMYWLRGIKVLSGCWLKFKKVFLQIAYDAFYGLQAAWQIAVNAITIAMIETTAALKKTWANFSSWHARTVEKLANWIAKKWFWLQSLFDDTIDMTFVNEYLDTESKRRFDQIEDQRTESLKQAEQQRRDLRDSASKEHEDNLNDLATDYNDQADKLNNEYKQRIADTEEKLKQARSQWQTAIAAAREGDDKAKSVERQLAGIGDFLTAQVQKISVVGTFNPAELSGLGTGSAMDRTAIASEQTALNTKRLLEETKNNNSSFS